MSGLNQSERDEMAATNGCHGNFTSFEQPPRGFDDCSLTCYYVIDHFSNQTVSILHVRRDGRGFDKEMYLFLLLIHIFYFFYVYSSRLEKVQVQHSIWNSPFNKEICLFETLPLDKL